MTNQWENDDLDSGSNGLATDPFDHDYPLCYTRSGTAAGNVIMTTEVTIPLQVTPPCTDYWDVCASGGGGGYTFNLSEQSGTVVRFTPTGSIGGYLEASLQSNALPSVITQFPLILNWSVSVDGGKTWVPTGATQNQVYVTWDNPIALTAGGGAPVSGGFAPYLTLLYVGCNAANYTAPREMTRASRAKSSTPFGR